jgi:diguanylate cyclase (GGDEF)-like protein/PAS domain S-box-containing protein
MAPPSGPLTFDGLEALANNASDFISVHGPGPDYRYLFVNETLARSTARRREDYLGRKLSELGLPDRLTRQWAEVMERIAQTREPAGLEFETRLTDSTQVLQARVHPLLGADGSVEAFVWVTRDTSETARAEAIRASQEKVMRLILSGATLQQIIKMIVTLAEQNSPGRPIALMLTSPDRQRLVPGFAPNVPAELIDAICSQPVAAGKGCCGAAAANRARVECADIATDAAWEPLRGVAQRHGLAACWSEPIIASDGAVLGTVTMYHRRARAAYDRELRVIKESALLAAIGIEHWQARDSLLEAEERFNALTANAANIVTVIDARGIQTYVSPATTAILGYAQSEAIGHPITDGVHREDAPRVSEMIQRLLANVGAQGELAPFRMRRRDGAWCRLESVARSHRDRHGHVIVVASTRDVSERERMTAALRDSEARLDRALNASGLGTWDWNLETGEILVDRQSSAMMGYPHGTGAHPASWIVEQGHPDDRAMLADVYRRLLKGEVPYAEYEYRGRTYSGEWKWLQMRAQVTARNAQGRALRLTGTHKDIDDRKQMEATLDSAMTRVELLLDATAEGIIGLDDVGACTFVNPAALQLLGCRSDELLGRDFSERVRHTRENGEELLGHDSPIHRCLTEGQRYHSGTDELFHCGGRSFPVELSVSPIRAGQGAVLAFHDVTEKRGLQHQLLHQALHDPLTGLLNRRGFEKRSAELLERAQGDGRSHALCYLDMDQFKVVNDTCGHVAGDELLRQLPQVLRRALRGSDVIARLGGDEFAILLEDCSLEAAGQVARQVREQVRRFRFAWQHRHFPVDVSIGVVGITPNTHDVATVLAAADAACYVAKDEGASRVHVSYPHDIAIVRLRGEMRWVARLRRAIEDNHFCLHYQPIASLRTGAMAHHELLVRLRDKGGLVMPGAFLPAAERYHLMSGVDRWVVENALRTIGEVITTDPNWRGHRFGINLSGESLRSRELLGHIEQALVKSGAPPSSLYFEVTETVAVGNLAAAISFMQRMRELGCHMALDDFGSGMSSFSYLKHLPVDYLKIDGAFIKDVVKNKVDQCIVRAACAVAQELGIATVAEHVENAETLDVLRGMGIDYAQGYAIARPRPLEEFVASDQGAAARVVTASAGANGLTPSSG